MYTVIGSPKSRSLRVIWMLEELAQPYTLVAAPPQSDDVVAVNPAGKVPVLMIEETPVTDSTAILSYLADKHGGFTQAPGTLERARQDSLTHFLLDEFDSVLWMAARHSFVLPKELRKAEIKDSLKWEFARSQRTLVRRMKGPFLMGDQMTVPDILLTHCGIWAEAAGFPIEEADLAEYLEWMRARPALLRAQSH